MGDSLLLQKAETLRQHRQDCSLGNPEQELNPTTAQDPVPGQYGSVEDYSQGMRCRLLCSTKSFMSSRKPKELHFLAPEAVDGTLARRVARGLGQARAPSSATRCRR